MGRLEGEGCKPCEMGLAARNLYGGWVPQAQQIFKVKNQGVDESVPHCQLSNTDNVGQRTLPQTQMTGSYPFSRDFDGPYPFKSQRRLVSSPRKPSCLWNRCSKAAT